MADLPPIYFHYQYNFSFPHRNLTKAVVAKIFKDHKLGIQRLDYIFCSDDQLLQINQHFLQHDTYTDIITFPLSAKGEDIVGEIYISVERVKENAAQFQSSFLEELNRVIFHGALHLCGYDDHTPVEQKAMRSAEEKYLHQRFT